MKKEKTKSVKIAPVKGRPMLYWVGKEPPRGGQYYPPQLREKFRVKDPAEFPYYDDFMNSGTGYNLLFHGDNKEILTSLLVGGFRGKVDLVYIDPPFDSGADYVRTVQLRGLKEQMAAAGHTLGEQAQYEDIWANDNYLQFMYERLILLRELMSERGSIYLHCDWHKSHHLRFLLDEIFCEENFRNEIIWLRATKPKYTTFGFGAFSDTILFYAKSDDAKFNPVRTELKAENIKKNFPEVEKETGRRYYLRPLDIDRRDGRVGEPLVVLGKTYTPKNSWQWSQETVNERIKENPLLIVEKDGMPHFKQYENGTPITNVWTDIPQAKILTGYPTEKPEALLERIITASSEPDSIVLDCFCGGGTAAAVAEKLGRRWIAADMNRGGMQMTMKRLGKIAKNGNGKNGYKIEGKRRGFVHYRVNNYDFAEESVMREMVFEKYNIEKLNGRDKFFDGLFLGDLVHIAKLNNPINWGEVELMLRELETRPKETRNVVIIGNGCEVGLREKIAKGDKRRAINKIRIIDLQQDGVFTYKPPEADVKITKSGKTATVKIADYVSPSIAARLKKEDGVLKVQITDFRSMIDRVLFDTDYDGKCFNIVCDDSPEKKEDLIVGEYTLTLPRAGAKVAVKIIDMLGEETEIIK